MVNHFTQILHRLHIRYTCLNDTRTSDLFRDKTMLLIMRREFPRLNALALGRTILAACAPTSTPTTIPTTAASPSPAPVQPSTPAPSGNSSLRVFGTDYPRAYFFRTAENVGANPKVSYTDWETSFARLMGIEGKVLDEEVPGRAARNADSFSRFKKQHPDQLVLLHFSGRLRDLLYDAQKFFAGRRGVYRFRHLLFLVAAERTRRTGRHLERTMARDGETRGVAGQAARAGRASR